jgi:signal transduction histidine kinase/ligand-binding sensor domain-containing protein
MEGISIFDGQAFSNFSVRDGLPQNNVIDIFEDRFSPGVMWIRVDDTHLIKFINGKFTDVTNSLPQPPRFFGRGFQDHTGAIWYGDRGGVYRIQNDSALFLHPQILSNEVRVIGETADSIMWFLNFRTLVSYIPERHEYRTYPDTISIDPKIGYVCTAFMDHTGNILISTIQRFQYQFHDGRLIGTRTLPAFSFSEDNRGNIWTSGNGLCVVSQKEFLTAPIRQITIANGLPSDDIRHVLIDWEDNVWAWMVNPTGLLKLSPPLVSRIPLDGTIVNVHGSQVFVSDSNNHIWAVVNGSLVESWRDKSMTWHKSVHSFDKKDTITSVVIDSKGRLWIEMNWWNNRIECYNVESAQDVMNPSLLKIQKTISLEQFKGKWAVSFIVDRKGDIWLSFGTGVGIVHIDPERSEPIVRIYGERDGVPTNYVRKLFEDREGNIWGGSFSDGVIKLSATDFNVGKWKHFTAGEGLPDNSINDLRGDTFGRMWIATDHGLAFICNDSVNRITSQDELPSATILTVAEDLSGRIWLGTTVGIAMEVQPGTARFQWRRDLVTKSIKACGMTRDGVLWFNTDTDLWLYDYASDTLGVIPPLVHITQLRVNGTEHPLEKHITNSFDQNNIELGFVGISFLDERAVRYRYRLLGLDTAWNGPTRNHLVTYAHLSPGEYTFEVTAINVRDVESKELATLTLTILSPLWQRWWFTSSVVLIFFALGPIIYYRRVSKLKKQQRTQEEISRQLIKSQEEDRKRIAAALHDGLGQDLLIIKNKATQGKESAKGTGTEGQFDDISQTVSEALDAAREIAYNLRPYQIDRIGLTKAIQSVTKRVATSSRINFNSNIDNLDNLFPKESEINLYRIVQESVTNILKHSEATAAHVTIQRKERVVTLTIEDDGKGFDVSAFNHSLSEHTGFGLRGISERVRILGGTFSVQSIRGASTTLTIQVPIPETKL